MKTGIVLEGGAKRGIYTAGVLDVLAENDVYPNGVIGVSAGAIHGCSYVSRQIGRSIRYNMAYGNDSRFMSFRSWIKTGNVVDVDFCYHELPEKLDVFDNTAFMKSDTDFYVVCSNVETGKAEYILCRDLFKEIDFLRASASLPFLSKIVDIEGKKLLDGGITDSIPLQAFERLGFQKNVVVLTRPAGYQKQPSFARWIARLVYRQYPPFVKAIAERAAMYNRELEYINEAEKQGRILVIRPSRFIPIKKMETDLQIVQEMYHLGRSDALCQLEDVKKFLTKP